MRSRTAFKVFGPLIIRYGCLMLILTLMISFLSSESFAESILPDNLLEIESEAFYGDSALERVVIPNNVSIIGERAFANSAIKEIVVPATVSDIATDAFDNVSTPVLLITTPNAYAVTYALNNELDFDADTEYRALIIGQTDYPDPKQLIGPGKDTIKMQDFLEKCGYQITTETNINADEMRTAILSAFADAGSEDISLLYYSGHGNQANGALVGIDMASQMSPTQLRNALDSIPGRKIVVVDACYSGALIGRSAAGDVEEATDPAGMFIDAFMRRRALLFSTLATQQYFVIVSSRGVEQSWEASYGGIFTDAFIRSRTYSDADTDGVITLNEAYLYTKQEVQNIAAANGKTQTVQVYPDNCSWFGLFR